MMNFPAVIFAASLPFARCSCGVYQLATAKSGDETDDYAFGMALAPVLLVTGDYPDTTAKNFKPFSYYADLIKARNYEGMTPDQAKMIITAMDRCFGDKSVKAMTEAKIISNFGPPDERMKQSGWTIYVYRILGGKFGERRLVMN